MAAVRGRPGEGSRAALAHLAGDLHAGLRDDLHAQGLLDDRDQPDDQPDDQPEGSSGDGGAGPFGICVDAVVGARRLAGWCLWVELLAVARLLTAWQGSPPILDARVGPAACAGADPALADRLNAVVHDVGMFVPTGERLNTADLAAEFVQSEISAAAGTSGAAAWKRVDAAAVIFKSDRLPRTRALLRAGLIDPTKLTTILTGTAPVADDTVCRLVEARLIPDADLALAVAAGTPGHVLDVLDPDTNPNGPGTGLPWIARATNPSVANRLAKAVAALDARAAAERAVNARAKRSVRAHALPDAMGSLTVETGREAITAIIGDLDTCAATAKAGGDPRTRDQIRTDELIHRISLGAFGAPATTSLTGTSGQTGTTGATGATGPAVQPGDANSSAAGAGCSCSSQGSPGRSARASGAGVRAMRVSLTMPLATWLGLADDPAVLDGYGPIPAALARQIATEAARDHPTSTTWRCIPLDDTHRTVLGVGDTIPTPRHDPTSRVRDLATTADPTCTWPNCSTRSSCDLDHRIPYHRGGVTCPCNLQPLCRKHHRLKGTGLIHSTRTDTRGSGVGSHRGETAYGSETPGPTGTVPAGTVDWTSWTGRSYRYLPPPLDQHPLDPTERAAAALADHHRHLDHTAANTDLDPQRYGDRGDREYSMTECWQYSTTRSDRRHKPAQRARTDASPDTLTPHPDDAPF